MRVEFLTRSCPTLNSPYTRAAHDERMRSTAHGTGVNNLSAVQERAAVLAVALFTMAVLWFGSAAASHLATAGVVGSLQTHTALGGLARGSEPADYRRAFEYVVAPLRSDAAATIRSIRIEARDLLPLRWGWGYL